MNEQITAGQWKKMRGSLKSWWGRLTDDDFDWISGEKDKLVGLIQEKYGQTRDQAQQEVERRLREYDAGGAISGITAKAQEFGETATTKAKEAVQSARSYLQEKDYADMADDVTHLVRSYPIQALLIGIGIGYLLARSTKR
ncbi:MAG TPA: CsbD family protein [Candidatus Binatia bacterium]|jgi:uncharacterized protein YjbJ (UPF0337 family)